MLVCVRCSTYGSRSDPEPVDGASDAATESPAPCWPTSLCGADVCCLAFDGGSECTTLADCPKGNAHIQCRSGADCADGSTCCVTTPNAAPDSGYSYVYWAACVPRGCTPSIENVACATQSDCEAGTCKLAIAFPQEGLLTCR